MPEVVRRGFMSEDAREFHGESLRLLRRAQADIVLLLDRGYGLKQAVTFAGDHYQLSARQRTALTRATCPSAALQSRREREMTVEFAGSTLTIDGFNLLITLEAALSESTVLRCMDGTLRDLCGLRGTYRLIDKTDPALGRIASRLEAMEIRKAVWVLDAPVSNSGRLAARIRRVMEGRPFATEVQLSAHADDLLAGSPEIVTTDSVILDRCGRWVNLAGRTAAGLPGFEPVDLAGGRADEQAPPY